MVLGMVIFLAGLAYGGFAGLRALFGVGPADAGWAMVLVALQLIGGCILCSLGLVGEYVGRVYEQVKDRPLYVLKERSPQQPAVPTGLDVSARKPYRTGPAEGSSAA
jgi:hypothetical protein